MESPNSRRIHVYSLLLSAKQVGVDPHAYLMAIAQRALANPGTVLLPTDYAAELAVAE